MQIYNNIHGIIVLTRTTEIQVVIGGSNLDVCCTTTEYPIQVKLKENYICPQILFQPHDWLLKIS